jgi:hypothetical protein
MGLLSRPTSPGPGCPHLPRVPARARPVGVGVSPYVSRQDREKRVWLMSKAVMDNALTLDRMTNLPRMSDVLNPAHRQDVRADLTLGRVSRDYAEAATGQRPGTTRPTLADVKRLAQQAAKRTPALPAGAYPLMVGPAMTPPAPVLCC